jgi:protein-S-isoprenylcysteine O-methyltransferase Ste14
MLGVQRTASPTEIKSAYRRLARKYHPDINPDPASARRFARLTDAYHILIDPQRRKLYDCEGVTADRTVAQRAQQSARAARRAYYQAQADRAVNEWLAKERAETKARGHAVFTTVTLFVSTFAVAMFKPGIVETANPFWYVVLILLFAGSIFHLALTLKRHFDHYTYQQELMSVMRSAKQRKPFTRLFAAWFMVGGYLFSLGLGFLLGVLAEDFTHTLMGETTWLDGLFSALFYPPIAVLIVDTMYVVNLRLEEW